VIPGEEKMKKHLSDEMWNKNILNSKNLDELQHANAMVLNVYRSSWERLTNIIP
jgi:hypothetical protein